MLKLTHPKKTLTAREQNFRAFVYYLWKEKGYTQQDIADIGKISLRMVQLLLNGERGGTEKRIELFADYLKISPEDIIEIGRRILSGEDSETVEEKLKREKEDPMYGLATLKNENLQTIVENWEYLSEEAQRRTVEFVKKLTASSYPHAAKAAKYQEYSKDRAFFIWEKGCKDAGLPGLFDRVAYESLLEKYLKKGLSDAQLYEASKKWAKEKRDFILKIEKLTS